MWVDLQRLFEFVYRFYFTGNIQQWLQKQANDEYAHSAKSFHS